MPVKSTDSSLIRRGGAAAFTIGIAMILNGDPGKAQPDAAEGRNRLGDSTSPYLLQHKNNPVHWYQWGPEAFEAAAKQEKPIFLSIGYSACHWCHVMEEESFEDPDTAAVMNRLFVNIKVDREERPDLDDIYMTAVQMLTGSGGWPMSVWLTPDLKPFYGGTYFPNDSRHGRPSFTQVLNALGEAWQKDRETVLAQSDKIHGSLVENLSGARVADATEDVPGPDLITRAIDQMSGNFDFVHGGFGRPPKFPPSRGLKLMLERHRETRDENLLRMATLTFDRMAYGGMYDQIGGGFHRYSVDAEWLVPHFEKMLYDNALLADAYIDAWQTTRKDLYRRIAHEIFGFVLREMTDDGGAFYSSLDADSDGEEGTFYVWRPDEVMALLGEKEGALMNDYYGITPSGNFEGGATVLHVKEPPEHVAERLGIPLADLMERIGAARQRLLGGRASRARPHLDDKVLTAWNGLMIAAFAEGGRALEETRYVKAGARAADFLLNHVRGVDGLMRVSHRAGRTRDEAFLDDQAFFIKGLIALHEATGEARWLAEARALVKATDATYWDTDKGGYFFARPARRDLIVRTKSPMDSAIPSGNSVMAASLVKLSQVTGEPGYRARAGEVLSTFGGGMQAVPGAFHNMLAALGDYVEAGDRPEPRTLIALTTETPDGVVGPGSTVSVDLRLDIQKGWHVNSASPTLKYLIPTSVSMEPGGLALATVQYPEGAMVSLGFAREPISVYEGLQVIRLRLAVGTGATPGRLTQTGTLRYQACNDEACLPPAEMKFEVTLQIAAARG